VQVGQAYCACTVLQASNSSQWINAPPRLLQIIVDNVQPGATIYNDGWTAYANVVNYGFEHYVVEHTSAFLRDYVNSVTRDAIEVHTNRIKGAWKHTVTVPKHQRHIGEQLWVTSLRGGVEKQDRLKATQRYFRAYHALLSTEFTCSIQCYATFPVFPTWFMRQQPSLTSVRNV